MSNIVISGYYGFGNAGDEAMLNAIVDSIRDIEPTANITVISGRNICDVPYYVCADES